MAAKDGRLVCRVGKWCRLRRTGCRKVIMTLVELLLVVLLVAVLAGGFAVHWLWLLVIVIVVLLFVGHNRA